MTIRALALAITLLWLVAGPIAACEPPPAQSASGETGGVRALTAVDDAATPTPTATDTSACTVKPRSLDEVRRLVARAHMAGATPTPEPPALAIEDLPPGKPADPTTIAALTATTKQFMACINAGDLLRLLALWSDDAVATFAPELGIPLNDPSFATPQPDLVTSPVRLGEVAGARLLSDGRAGALILPANPSDDPVFLYFVHQGDQWLIDGFIEVTRNTPDNHGPCCAIPSPPSPTSWQLIRGDNFEGVIVPAAAGSDFFTAVDGTERSGYWTPSNQQIIQLEDNLWHYLTPPPCGESPAPSEIWQNLGTYHRQYAGFTTDDGQQRIEVHFFCDAFDGPWQTQPVSVQDGGACFFQITYDPATEEFSDLRINGEA